MRARPLLRSLLRFSLHQFVGTLGTAFLTALALLSVAEALQIFRVASSMRWAHWILTETPYYPLQILVAFYLGWVMWKRFPTQLASFVWVLPFLLFSFAFAAGTMFSPPPNSVLFLPHDEPSRFSHWFGWGCRPAAHCLDQLVLTVPLYVSVAYSIAARLARRSATRHSSVQTS